MVIVQAFRPVSVMVTNGFRVCQLLRWRNWARQRGQHLPCEKRAVSESRVQVVRAIGICQKCYIDEYTRRRYIRLGIIGRVVWLILKGLVYHFPLIESYIVVHVLFQQYYYYCYKSIPFNNTNLPRLAWAGLAKFPHILQDPCQVSSLILRSARARHILYFYCITFSHHHPQSEVLLNGHCQLGTVIA